MNLFARFKHNFVNAQDVKNICAQIFYICSRIMIKNQIKPDGGICFTNQDRPNSEATVPSGDYLNTILSASDIFALQQVVTEMFHALKLSLCDTAATQGQLTKKAMEYIAENIADDLSLEQIADHLHISASHLSRTFKKNADISLTDYINQIRIGKAKELLRTTDIYIYAISEMVGYRDATYFSSIFKKLTGVSPSEYRNPADQIS